MVPAATDGMRGAVALVFGNMVADSYWQAVFKPAIWILKVLYNSRENRLRSVQNRS